VQVEGHQREGHQGHRQAREGDECGHGRAWRVTWSENARDADRRGRASSRRGAGLELSTTHCAVHRVLTMFESHYQGLDRTTLNGGWAPGISDDQCDELEEGCAAFARDMADATLKALELLPQDESGAPGVLRPPN
jgi:hypothetical protein